MVAAENRSEAAVRLLLAKAGIDANRANNVRVPWEAAGLKYLLDAYFQILRDPIGQKCRMVFACIQHQCKRNSHTSLSYY